MRIDIPTPSILAPTPEAAVVGGNVLTSQRVTDVVLKAFRAAAASQVLSAGCVTPLSHLCEWQMTVRTCSRYKCCSSSSVSPGTHPVHSGPCHEWALP